MGWKTSQKIWETKDYEAYLIGYFPTPQAALKVKKEIEQEYGVKIHADIRLYGVVKKGDHKNGRD